MWWAVLIIIILFGMAAISKTDSATYYNDSEEYDCAYEKQGYRGGRGTFEVTYTKGEKKSVETIENAVSEFDAYEKFLNQGVDGKAFISAKRIEKQQ